MALVYARRGASGEEGPRGVVLPAIHTAEADIFWLRILVIESECIFAQIDMAVDPVREMFSSRTQQQRPFKRKSLSARRQVQYDGTEIERYQAREEDQGQAGGGGGCWKHEIWLAE